MLGLWTLAAQLERRTIVGMRATNVAPKAQNLTPEQCWKLLAETSVGRLALTIDNQPDVFPVSYKVDGESVVFRTGGGRKLEAIHDDARVALEADAVSGEFGVAWSVVIRGLASVMPTDDQALNAATQGMFPWQGVGKDHLIRVVPQQITGRRFTLDSSMTWTVPLDESIRAGLE